MKYRALDPKDIHEAGDEFKHRGQWLQVPRNEGEPVGDDFPCRRPITEPDSPWIPISSPPTEADANELKKVIGIRPNRSVVERHWSGLNNDKIYVENMVTHWMRIPPLPLPEPEPEPTKNEALASRISAAIRPDWIAPKSLTKTILDALNAENPE